ncbi:transposase [Bradyrhizobium sp. 197]|nr:transposase [Bradyrhizobium sp. 197]
MIGFAGLLQVNGYAAYNLLTRSAGTNECVRLAACFAHVRSRCRNLTSTRARA